MPSPTVHSTIAQLFFEQALTARGLPLLWRKEGNRLVPYSRNEAAEWIAAYARGLKAVHIARGARIALLGTPNEMRLLVMLAHALLGITTVAMPEEMSQEERLYLLRQSHCSVLLVETAAQALPFIGEASGMGEMHHVIGLRGPVSLPTNKHVTTLTLEELIRRGRALPDQTSHMLLATRKEDAAIIVGTPQLQEDGKRNINLVMKTHGELLDACERLAQLLHNAQIDLPAGAPILVYPSIGDTSAFLATQLLALTLDGSLDYLSRDLEDTHHFRLLQPQLLIADSGYLHNLHARLESLLLVQSDRIDRWAGRWLLRLGKQRFEHASTLPWWQEAAFWAVRHALSIRLREQLGSSLKGILCVDENLNYSTLIFFETFGLRVVEIPAVFDSIFEKRRL